LVHKKRHLALWLALAIHTPMACRAAERYVFDIFDQERGLGDATITRLALDRHGALWVGTEGGLYRYDGHRFVAFTVNDGLPSNKITTIHEGPDGTLWVGTLEGLAWRDGAGFRKAANEALRVYINPNAIASDRTGTVYVATRRGIVLTSAPGHGMDPQVSFLPWPASIAEHRSSDVYAVSPNELWFDCATAICRWNGKDTRVWGPDAGVPAHKWDFFIKDESGNLWARNRDSLIELPSGADHFQTVGPDVPGPISIPPGLSMDQRGRILVTSNRGLAIGGRDGWRYVSEKNGLPTNLLTAAIQDSEGSMWLGTYGAGLVRWAGYDSWRGFTQMDGLPSSYLTSVLDDPPSGMWVGTTGGLGHGKFSNGAWTWSEISIPGTTWVTHLMRAKDGALWMITDHHYLTRYDPVSHAVQRLGPLGNGPFHIRVDEVGRLWIADSGGILVGPAASRLENFERMRPSNANPATTYTYTLEDAKGDLWVGSMAGLYRKSQGKWFHYDTSNGLSALRIWDLALSPEGDLWVAYSDLVGMDRVRVIGETVQVEKFNHSKGLPDDHVNSIGFDHTGQMWVLNDHGVALRRGNAWLQLGRADGLIASDTAADAFADAHDGAVWVGTSRGLSRYEQPKTDEAQVDPHRVVFSEIRVGNQSIDPALERVSEVRPQTFEAKFSAMLLAHAADVQYRYRFVGLDDRWQETVRPEVRLDYPSAGRYRLEVQARRAVDPWKGPTTTLALEVRPRWYETWMFRGALLALLCAVLWLAERFRQRKAEAARHILERTVDQRTAELRESEERFRHMADNAPVMIWLSGPDKVFTFFNKTRLEFSGHALASDLKGGWVEGVHQDDLNRCTAAFTSAYETRHSFVTEFRRRRADGEYRWVLCKGVPRFTHGGEFSGFIGSEVDVTDVKRAEQEVVSRQKLESLSVLTAGIAHDFNNLLGSIVADAELAGSDLDERLAPHEELDRIKAVAVRASEIVRELMVYSGQDRAVFEPVDLSKVVGEMTELLKVSIPKNAMLKTDLAVNLPLIMGSAPQIRQIVMNLIINAAEAIGTKEGVIRISTSSLLGAPPGISSDSGSPANEFLRLAVTDTGGGMTDEQKARIFDPFFSTKFAGRGLGLAVVQGIVRAHGGEIHVMTRLGEGATFQIFFPRTPLAERRDCAPKLPARRNPDDRTVGTVLLVEDEVLLRLPLAKMLRRHGLSVIEAPDGLSAIERFREKQDSIDLILLDLTIGGCPSADVLAEATRIQPAIKVILMSAYSREMVPKSLDVPQVLSFIRKPFQANEMIQLLQSALSSEVSGH
jgi:PAS domain S-box-containing protein